MIFAPLLQAHVRKFNAFYLQEVVGRSGRCRGQVLLPCMHFRAVQQQSSGIIITTNIHTSIQTLSRDDHGLVMSNPDTKDIVSESKFIFKHFIG